MKKASLLIIAILLSVSLMAQLQRNMDANHTAIPQKEDMQNETLIAVKSNVYQDFELYNDFSLNIYPWTTNDVDGYATFGITNYGFPHSGEAMSYIVFNPSETTPPILDDPALLPHGGYRFAACFASQTHANNDWIISPLIELGTNSRLKFWVKSYTVNFGLERYKVGVSTTNTNPASFTFISGGSYLEAPADAWVQKDFDLSAYNGMEVYVGIQCVSDNAFIFMLDDMEIISDGPATSTLTGNVSDAVTGNPVPEALVTVAGLSDYTDAGGNYSIANIPAGILNADFTATPRNGSAPLSVQFTDLSSESTHSITASAAGYALYSNNQVVIPEDGSLDLQIALSPALETGQYRFILTWGESPEDLNSHLKTPSIEDSVYHIYFENQGSADSQPFVILDIDDTMAYGPETTTIFTAFPGEYHYYVHNYSGITDINSSNAVVQVYNKNGLRRTIQVPTTGTGAYWDVCTLNGSNGNINIINQLTESDPGGFPKLAADQIKKKCLADSRNLTTWNWNFGDGTSSTEQNPSHSYTTNGTYEVSLVISDGLNLNTEVKSNYILVGPVGENELEMDMDINIYPNPAKEQVHINSELSIESIALFDLSGQEKMIYYNCGIDCTLNLEGFSDGIYLLRIQTEKGSFYRKLNIR